MANLGNVNLNGLPNIGNVQISANNASYAVTASYAETASVAGYAGNIATASYANVAGYVLNSGSVAPLKVIGSNYKIQVGDNLIVTATNSILLTLPPSVGSGSQFNLIVTVGSDTSISGSIINDGSTPDLIFPNTGVQTVWSDIVYSGSYGWYVAGK